MIFDIIIFFIVGFFGFKIPFLFSFDASDRKKLNWLWIYHLVFGIYFYFSILELGGSDSLKYWLGARKISSDNILMLLFDAKGTRAMYSINYFPSAVLNISFFGGTLFYTLLGFVGLVLFYKIAIDHVPYNSRLFGIKLFPFLFFLPNLHFWTVGIGKDVLSFFAVALFSFAMLNFKKRFIYLILSLIIAFVIRPHIALFLVLAFGSMFVFKKSTKNYIKIFSMFLFLGMAIVILPIVAEYAKVDEISVEGYENFSQDGIQRLSRAHTTSSVDVSSYPFPLKVFTFLFRPTFIDLNGVPSLIAAFENLFLLILSIRVLVKKPRLTFRKSPFVIKGLLIFLLIGAAAFSLSLGNLGIMLRMRNMFLPGLMIYILWSLSLNAQMEMKKSNIS